MATLLAGIAQFERDLLSERVKSCLAAARARGKKLERQPPHSRQGRRKSHHRRRRGTILSLDRGILADVPSNRVTRLRRHGERYFAGDLWDISSERRLAILAVCAVEWRSAIADAVVKTRDVSLARPGVRRNPDVTPARMMPRRHCGTPCNPSLPSDQPCWKRMKTAPRWMRPSRTRAAGHPSRGWSRQQPN